MANRGGFSWKRALGVTKAKQRISRKIGIPLTKSGRQRKIGKIVTGGGCLLPVLIFIIICISAVSVLAHPGRLDKNGGHHNTADGTYHYHIGDDRTIEYKEKPTATEPKNIQQVQENKNSSDKDITVTLNGENLIFDQPPIIINDRTFVPLRSIFEALGATVEWNDATQTVTATNDYIVIQLQIGNNVLTKNNEKIITDAPAQIVNGRTLVPIRVISESFGVSVEWDNETNTVILNSPKSNTSPGDSNVEDNNNTNNVENANEPKELSYTASISKSEINNGGVYSIVFSLTANGSGGAGGYKYRFEVVQNGKIITAKDYSTSNSISSTIKGSGDFFVRVFVRDSDGTVVKNEHSLTE